MELSKRLQAVADLVTAGYRVADIGTDHAYIPIFLLASGKISGAVAMDVNEGPLERARCHVAENGLSEKISLRLSDGLAGLRPGEAESVVIAGMGGGLIIRILTEGAGALEHVKECVLQPQSEIEKVRAFLLEEGFLFIKEDMVEEDGKYYPMMKMAPPGRRTERTCGTAETWDETELRYGRYLLQEKNPVLMAQDKESDVSRNSHPNRYFLLYLPKLYQQETLPLHQHQPSNRNMPLPANNSDIAFVLSLPAPNR